MTRRKCLGCANEFKAYECTYSTKGILINCPCANCLIKPACTKSCVAFIDLYFKSKNRLEVFDEVMKTLRERILK
jgi:hypothetical protein